ncbi:MAG: methyltransferase domain-containing protein [Melioribacteraceae bacterium]
MAEKHYYEQREFTRNYLIPYFQKHIPNFSKMKVLEVGCAEGGLIEEFLAIGIDAAGIELDEKRAEIAHKKNPLLKVIVGDITDLKLTEKIHTQLKLSSGFDFIIMREVIEHIKNKKAAFENINKLLNENGFLFISFPPKYSPFAGHQQIGKSFLKAIPYLHLLPKFVLKPAAKILNEREDYIDEIKLHFSTGCTISEFERLSREYNFQKVKKDLYLFRPIYSIRFGLPTIKLPDIPLLNEYISFGCEVLLRKNRQ